MIHVPIAGKTVAEVRPEAPVEKTVEEPLSIGTGVYGDAVFRAPPPPAPTPDLRGKPFGRPGFGTYGIFAYDEDLDR